MSSVKRAKSESNHHRTWLPLVLMGAILVALFIWAYIASTQEYIKNTRNTPETQIDTTILVQTYKVNLKEAIDRYEGTGSDTEFLQQLLTMRVPSDYLPLHVKLVSAADQEGFSEQGLRDTVQSVRFEYTWLQ